MIEKLKKIFGSFQKSQEIIYLINNLKDVVRQGFYDYELEAIENFCRENNLFIEKSPFKVVLLDEDKEYSNKGKIVPLNSKEKGMLFVYISKDPRKALLASLYEVKKDHLNLGILLGYPSCCIKFFNKHFQEESKGDLNFIKPILDNSNGYEFPWQNNIFLRNKDFTLLSHFPCSLACKASLMLANKYYEIIKAYDVKFARILKKKLKTNITINNRKITFI